ncbi:MAG: hypothetical protein ABEK36_06165 [Candidatus Aenigmatarchaeota archaeon]
MSGLKKLDEMVFHVIESIATGKDITAKDIEYAAHDMYPKHAELLITIIKNKPEFMELWGEKPQLEDMHLAVIETLPKNYSKKQFKKMAKQLFPSYWHRIFQLEK